MTSQPLRDHLTIAQSAIRVGRSRDTIERWLRDGLPAQRVLGRRYINTSDLLAHYRKILEAEPELRTRWNE